MTFGLDFGEILSLIGGAGCGVVLLRLRAVQRHHLRARLQAVIAEAAEALQEGAVVVAEDARIRIRRMPPGE